LREVLLVNELIEALMILRQYASPQFPTHCEHDVLYVDVDPRLVSAEDLARLKALWLEPDEGMFRSTYFGSC
jgi:hypothetical protein